MQHGRPGLGWILAGILSCAILSAALPACSIREKVSPTIQGLDSLFPVIVPGAIGVRKAWEAGLLHFTYEVADPFPGDRTRIYLVTEQRRLGWLPRLVDISGTPIPHPEASPERVGLDPFR
jgi:hypothetical protein